MASFVNPEEHTAQQNDATFEDEISLHTRDRSL